MPLLSRVLPLLLDDDRCRTMLSTAAALLVVAGLMHAPVPIGNPRVGWEVQPSRSTIHLTEVREVEGAGDAAPDPAAASALPPVTRQTTESDEGRGRSSNPAPAPEAAEGDTATSSQALRRMTAMSVYDKPPEIAGGPGALFMRIQYPAEARRQGIQGRVVLAFTVSPTGWPEQIEVLQSLHPLCDSAAAVAVRKTRFVPGRRDGEAVPIRMRLPIRFELRYLDAPTQATRPSSQ